MLLTALTEAASPLADSARRNVAGCAAYQQKQLEQAQAQAAAQAANDDAQCQSYGATPGSPVYVQCRMNLDQAQVAANDRAVAIQYLLSHR
jgi:hypothetical protein